jgi:hypothetical protein
MENQPDRENFIAHRACSCLYLAAGPHKCSSADHIQSVKELLHKENAYGKKSNLYTT